MPERTLGAAAPQCPEVLRPDIDDARGDEWLDGARRRRQQPERGHCERQRMGRGESGDDLHQLQRAPSEQQQADEEREVVVAGEDVLDAEEEKTTERASRRSGPPGLERRFVPLGDPLRQLAMAEVDPREVSMPAGKGLEKPDADGKLGSFAPARPARVQRQAVFAVRLRRHSRVERAGLARRPDHERLDDEPGQRRQRRRPGVVEAHLPPQIGEREAQGAFDLAPVRSQLAVRDARLVRERGRGQEQQQRKDAHQCAMGRTPASRRLLPSSRPRPAAVRASRFSPSV